MGLSVVVLAAGKGSRIHSKYPKVLQKLAGKYLLEHVVNTVQQLDADEIVMVQGHLADQVRQALQGYGDKIKWVTQQQRLGTGHAVLQALEAVNRNNKVLILYGDVPLISVDTLDHFVNVTHSDQLGILTVEVQNPGGLGRIIRNKYHEVTKIVEERDATDYEKQIREINTGIYCASAAYLAEWLPALSNNNAQGEYYLTDIVAMARDADIGIRVAQPVDSYEIAGVNTRAELARLERIWQKAQAEQIMAGGVSIADPERVDVRGQVQIGQDSWVDINVVFEGEVSIGEDCHIGPGCVIRDTVIGAGAIIRAHTVIEGATLADNVSAGPFARIRPGTCMAADSHIGNFVEVKDSTLGAGVKAGHLSYLGNAEIGPDCNIGAGVITCNYDGSHKHTTTLGSRVFVGSNSALVAPVRVADGVTIGAGTTLTKIVDEADSLALSRAPQRTLRNWHKSSKTRGR